MEAEVREQPAILAANSARYYSEAKQFLEGKSFDMVVLAARGSSDNAALFARYLIEVALQIPVCLAAPSVLTRYGSRVNYRNALAIGISQSGAGPDVSEVMADLTARGQTTLAITNTPGSRLALSCQQSIVLEAGEERSIAATKTYSASLLALVQVVRALGAEAYIPQVDLPSDDWVASCRASAEQQLRPVLRGEPVFSLARGWSFCTAHEGALKLMECALIPCKAYSTADFAHGPQALAEPGTSAVCYTGIPEGLRETGCQVVEAPQPLKGPLDPLFNVVFAQWTALLAARARGLDPDKAQNLKKVTQTL
jgi:glucosamine--fructose-6-phosphate aminotransferase (isomerizing)